MGVGGKRHASVALPAGMRAGTYCMADWVGPRGRSGRVRKISPPPGFDPRTVEPIASNTNVESGGTYSYHCPFKVCKAQRSRHDDKGTRRYKLPGTGGPKRRN